MSDMVRVMVFDRTDAYRCDIDPDQIMAMDYEDALNGVHSLTITTTQELEKTDRLLVRDGMGIWHEYVVLGVEADHGDSDVVTHEHYCVWSLQYDMSVTFVDDMYGCGYVPGHPSVPQAASHALEVALEGTSRWQVGTVTVTSTASASFYRRNGWEALQTVIEKWGGELRATITVGANGVVERHVDLLAHLGQEQATRRFDYGSDLTGIRRIVSDDPWPCRIVPLGKSVETESGGYTRRPDIADVNGGVMWIEDAEVAQLVRIPDGHGGWEYPTTIVTNDTYEDPSELKSWALEHITDYTRPQATYEADVAQFVAAGMNPHGVSLGDEVAIVDRTFCEGGLRLNARVVKIKGSMLDPTDMELTIGNAKESLSHNLSSLSKRISGLEETVGNSSAYQATAAYLSNLLDRLNAEINATGGYWYMIPGLGTRTYDREVSDPAVGTEASKVVEVRGGNIRIANSRTSGGDWDWRTVFQSGHILSDLVTAAKLTAGYIGSADSGNYWNLDTGEFRMASTSMLGNKTVQQVINGVNATITGVDVEYASNTSPNDPPAESSSDWSTTAPAWRSGWYIWSRTATTTAGSSTPEYSTPVMISGRDGANGTNGTNGTNGRDGTDGVGISSTTVQYGTSNSPNTEPTNWSSTAPTSLDKGKWMWVKTVYNYTDGRSSNPSYSKSYMGRDGTDGTSVTIKGSYDTLAQLKAAHPTGSDGDAYMVGADLYVWNGSEWENVGQIQGPQGIQGPAGQNGTNGTNGKDGKDGTSVTVSKIEYGTSNSASTQPSSGSWSTTAPTSLAQGKWLWVKTTYSNGSVATTKSYIGTDGEDGKSVWVKSSTKSGDTTTIILIDSDGHETTMTIKDGEDGTNGTNGTNGLSGYVHTAWANSADGKTDFSTSVSTNKKYLGVYTDNTAADSTSPSKYSWSLIKGANGEDGMTAYVHTAWANSADGRTDFSTSVSTGKSYLGVYSDFEEADSTTPSMYKWSKIEGEQGEDGVGVSQIVEQYYLSTSSSTLSGSSWQTTPQAYISGRFYWTRSQVTWTDGRVTTTDPVLARGINSANNTADEASKALAALKTQEAIFNLLTNNGAMQGLYMNNGQLYINATYLKSGIISGLTLETYTNGTMTTPSGKKVHVKRVRLVDGWLVFERHEMVYDSNIGGYRPTDADNWIEYFRISGDAGINTDPYAVIRATGMLLESANSLSTSDTSKKKDGNLLNGGTALTGLLRFPHVGGDTNYENVLQIVNGRIVGAGKMRKHTSVLSTDTDFFTSSPARS